MPSRTLSYDHISGLMKRMYCKVPSEPQYQRIVSIANELGLRDNDEFILLIIILEMHKAAMYLAPSRIAEKVVANLRDMTKQSQEAIVKQICDYIDTVNGSDNGYLEGIGQKLAGNQKSLLAALTAQNEKLAEIAVETKKAVGEISFRTKATLALGGLTCFCLGVIVSMLLRM